MEHMLINDYYELVSDKKVEFCGQRTDTDQCDFPNESKTKDSACNKTRKTLDNGSQRDARQTIDLLWVIAQLSSQRTGL